MRIQATKRIYIYCFEHSLDCINEFINFLAISDERFEFQDILTWFGLVHPVAEYIASGYLSPDLDTSNSKTVDCKEQLIHSQDLPKVYQYYLTHNESFLSNVPVSIYQDACWVAHFTNDVIQLVTESAPELFRAFQESSIIPEGKRVFDYMKELI